MRLALVPGHTRCVARLLGACVKGERDKMRVSLNEHNLMAQGDVLPVGQPKRKAFVEHQAEDTESVRE